MDIYSILDSSETRQYLSKDNWHVGSRIIVDKDKNPIRPTRAFILLEGIDDDESLKIIKISPDENNRARIEKQWNIKSGDEYMSCIDEIFIELCGDRKCIGHSAYMSKKEINEILNKIELK